MLIPELGAPSEIVINQCVLQQVITHAGKSGLSNLENSHHLDNLNLLAQDFEPVRSSRVSMTVGQTSIS